MNPATLQAARLLDADFLYFLASAGWGVNVGLALFFLVPRDRSAANLADRGFWLTVAAAFLSTALVCVARLFGYFGGLFQTTAWLHGVAHAGLAAAVWLSLAVLPQASGWHTRRAWVLGAAAIGAAAVSLGVALPGVLPAWAPGAWAGVGSLVLLGTTWRMRRLPERGGASAAACAALGAMLVGLGIAFSFRGSVPLAWNHTGPVAEPSDPILAWHGAVMALAALLAFGVIWRRYLETRTLLAIRERRGLFGLRPVAMLPVLEAAVLACGSSWFIFSSQQAEDYAARRLRAEVATIVQTLGERPDPEPQVMRRHLERIVRGSGGFLAAAAWTETGSGDVVLQAAVTREGTPAPFDAAALLPSREALAEVRHDGGLRWVHGATAFEQAVVYAPVGSQGRRRWHLSLAVDGRDLAGLVAAHRLQALAIFGLGVVVVAVAVAYTIRSLNEAELRLLKEGAEAENNARNAFLAMISHEIRTPLQSVLGYAELAESTGLPDSAARHVRAIRTQGAILLRIVQDILDFSAMRGGALTLNPEVVSLRELLDDVQRGMTARAQAKGIVFSTEIEDSVPPWVTVDRVRLTQVLLNLAVNAVKFTDRGGVRIAVGCNGVSDDCAAIEILVSDTGPGISAVQMRRLFEPFRKMRDDDTPGGGGVGLGLAICRQIIELLKGTIAVESSDGEGTAFRLRLSLPVASVPKSLADTMDPATVPAQVPSLAGLSVLLIDDNPYVRELLRDFLRKLGAEVTARADGTSGLAACAQAAHDIILLDLRLPDFAGADLAGRLRALARSPTDPWIVAISAGVSDAEIQATLERGVNDFMLKPVSMAGLAETIRMSPAAAKIPPEAGTVAASTRGATADQRAAFFAELEPMFDRLEQSCLEEQGPRLGAEAHYLANGCMVTGFEEGLAVCREIEQLAEAGAFEAARRRIAALRNRFAGGAAARGT